MLPCGHCYHLYQSALMACISALEEDADACNVSSPILTMATFATRYFAGGCITCQNQSIFHANAITSVHLMGRCLRRASHGRVSYEHAPHWHAPHRRVSHGHVPYWHAPARLAETQKVEGRSKRKRRVTEAYRQARQVGLQSLGCSQVE
jgi:hypothetical protein